MENCEAVMVRDDNNKKSILVLLLYIGKKKQKTITGNNIGERFSLLNWNKTSSNLFQEFAKIMRIVFAWCRKMLRV